MSDAGTGHGYAFPLSPGQRRLFFHDQWSEPSAAYNVPYALRLEGDLDADALRRALDLVVARHEALRTRFTLVDDAPAQQVMPHAPLALDPEDARGLDGAVRLAAEEAATPFRLDEGKPCRFRLLRLGPQDHVLLLTFHHIVFDGWSSGVLFRELAEGYAAFREGRAPGLPDIPIQFVDYAVYEDERAATGEAAKELEHWVRHLQDVPALELPTDKPRPATRTGAGANLRFQVDADTRDALHRFCRETNATPFMALLAAFEVLLARHAGQTDFAVGTPVAGRVLQETEPLIGFFVNTLALRSDVRPGASYRDLVARVRATALDGLARQSVPFERVVDALHVPRDPSRTPLAQAVFAFQNAGGGEVRLHGLRVTSMGSPSTTAKFDLTWSMADSPVAGLRGSIEYSTDLFTEATARAMGERFRVLLRSLLAAPDAPVDDADMLPPEERALVTRGWTGQAVPYPRDARVESLFDEQVRRAPDAWAVVADDQRLTYRELDARARALAVRLAAEGVRRGDLLALHLERGADAVVAMLATLRAGAAYVPLDPAYPEERLAFMLADTRAPVVVTTTALAGKLPASAARTLLLDAPHDAPEALPAPEGLAATDLAYVMYTSGSTGQPKGVAVPHRAIVRLLLGQDYVRIGPDDALLQFAPLSFDAATFEVWGALLHGATVAVAPPGDLGLAELGRVIRERGVTTMWLTAPLFHVMVDEAPEHLLGVRQLISGGDALSPPHVAKALDALPGLRLVNGYGPTESTTFACCHPITREDLGKPSVPIGRPLANTRALVLDARGNPVPPGVYGELHLGGDGLADGYLGRPDLTAERFVERDGERLYRTGDVVRWLPDGTLEFAGRRDDQVKVRGFRIELGEVEAAVRRATGVRDAAVVARQDGAQKRLVAYVVMEPGRHADEARDDLKRRLPPHMVPGTLVMLDALPLTPNGKVDRKALPEPDAARAPAAPAAPLTPTEEALLDVWREVLRRPNVGPHDNFFDLGGDSILSIQLAARAAKRGLKLTPKMLFEAQTVAELAARVVPATAAKAEDVTGPFALTPIQRWFFETVDAEPHHFNQSLLLRLPADVDDARVRDALHALVDQHDALRLRFWREGDAWRQEARPPGAAPPAIERVDLRDAPPEERTARLEATCAARQRALDHLEGRLVCAVVFDLGDEKRLLLVVHHLAVDAVSWPILLEDLESALKGEPLAPAPTSYAAWARALEDLARDPATLAELPYWERAADARLAPLPRDRDGENLLATMRRVEVALTEDETTALLEAPRTLRVTMHEALLGALHDAVASWSGASDLLVDVEGHGREALGDLDLTRTVGWFTAIYPLLLRRGGDGPFAAAHAARDAVASLPRKGASYPVLRHLSEEGARRLAPLPKAEIGFNYLGRSGGGSADDARRLAVAPERRGQEFSLAGSRAHVLDVDAIVKDGRLGVALRYSEALHDRATIERLAQRLAASLRALAAAAREDADGPTTFPLSPMQEGMLFHSVLDDAKAYYLEQLDLRLDGEVDADAMEKAWRLVVERHSVFRTSFEWQEGGAARQRVHKAADLEFSRHDWSHVPASERDARRRAFLQADRERGLDLARAPVMRLALVRMDDATHHLVWTFHHVLLDGWSLSLVLREVVTAYHAYATGQAPELPPARPYSDYLLWLERRPRAEAEAYWRRQLDGFRGPTPLGIDTATAPPPPDAAIEVKRALDPALAERILACARRLRVTPSTLVTAAWGLVLSRYSGEEDVVFGVTVSGRPPELPGVESSVGLFINTLPVRMRVDPGATVASWAAALQDALVEQRQHGHLPLSAVQSLAGRRDGAPLFESLLVYENYPVSANEGRSDGARLRIRSAGAYERTNYPLALAVEPGQRWAVRVGFDPARVPEPAAARVIGHLVTTLEAFAADPARTLGSVGILTPEERDELRRWNGALAPVPGEPLDALLRQAARRAPDKVALAHGARRVTYREMDARSDALAARLHAMGVRPGHVVAVCMRRGVDPVVSMVGALKAGATYLPLDASMPAPRLLDILAEARPACLLAGDGTPAEALAALPTLDVRTVEPGEAAPAVAPRSEDDPAYVIYTSGSTGRPKGIVVPHRGVKRLVHENRYARMEDDLVVAQASNLAFDASVLEVYTALLTGSTLVVLDRETLLSVDELVATFRREGVTTLFVTTALFNQVARERPDAFSTLRHVFFGGEAADARAIRAVLRAGPPQMLLNMYGPTETTVVCTAFDVRRLRDEENVPIGSPIAGATCQVVGPALDLKPIGVPGQLAVGGPCVADGYLGRPDLTAERFVADPYRPGGRLYLTGDIVRRREDGELEFLGRMDDQVKVRGFRVELGEVEAALRACPNVVDAVVSAPRREDGTAALVAHVVPAPGFDAAATRATLRARLPEYMVPGALVRVERFPLNANGKVDRRALPPPALEDHEVAGTRVAPSTPAERLLAEAWREVLGMDPGATDDFFASGGSSILAMRLVSTATSRGLRLRLRDVFDGGTLAGIAARAEGAGGKHLVALREEGDLPPLVLVHPGGGSISAYLPLAPLLDARRPVYALQASGIDASSRPHDDVREMARAYLADLRAARPRGPYALGGWSLGALVAQEMTRQLEAEGEQVVALLLVDPVWDALRVRGELAASIVTRLRRALDLARSLAVPDAGKDAEAAQAELRTLLASLGVPPGLALPEVLLHLELQDAHFRGLAAHEPGTHAAPTTLVMSEKTVAEHPSFDEGWRGLAQGRVAVVRLPGDHMSLLRPPHLAALAGAIDAALSPSSSS